MLILFREANHVTKVLVVDDEQSIVTLLKYNLETAGYIVDVAYDGEEALKKLKRLNLN